ncbi:MAG: acyl-CoA thioesterase [Planctomycetales bacterium]|nr:acyl-CoA thioesterase [Planctomycetales bacterium]
MAEPFRTTRMVEFHDTDMAGIMHFASFFCYMESAEHELLRSLGLSVNSMFDGHPVSFPRVAASCEYRSPAHCEEFLDIAVNVARIGERSVTYGFRFTHGERLVAEGRMTSVCCRMHSGHRPTSMPIPEKVAEQLAQYAAAEL